MLSICAHLLAASSPGLSLPAHSLVLTTVFVVGEMNHPPNAMECELAKTAEGIVCVKGNEVGFGCYRSTQPVPQRNKVLAPTTASLSPLSHATADSLSPSLCAAAASLSPSPYASAASRSPSPLLSHYCCVTLYCLTIAASLCIVSLPLSHYRCLTTTISLPLSHYRCLTIAASV